MILSSAATGSDAAVSDQLGPEDEGLAERAEFPLRGLHAKLFVSEYYHGARLWTGSANATNAAFNGNVEFLVELQGPRGAFGIDAVLEGQSGGVKLRDLLETYEPPAQRPDETEQQKVERRLDEIRREVAALGFEASVFAEGSDVESYSLVVRATAPAEPDTLRGVRAHLWPITLGMEAARPLQPAFSDGVRFEPVSFVALTAFFAIELEAGRAACARRPGSSSLPP